MQVVKTTAAERQRVRSRIRRGGADLSTDWLLKALDDLDTAEESLDFALRRMPDGWERERIREVLRRP